MRFYNIIMTIQEIIFRISQMRAEANLSARELSGRIGKSGSYINALEAQKGGFEPSLSALLDIIEVCGKTPEEFFYHDPAQYKQDMQLLQYFKRLTPEQKAVILSIYK